MPERDVQLYLSDILKMSLDELLKENYPTPQIEEPVKKPWYKKASAALLAILLALGITAGAAKAESGYIIVDGKPQMVQTGQGSASDNNKEVYNYQNGIMYDKNNQPHQVIMTPSAEQPIQRYQQPEQDDYQRKIAEYDAMVKQDPTNAKLYREKVSFLEKLDLKIEAHN